MEAVMGQEVVVRDMAHGFTERAVIVGSHVEAPERVLYKVRSHDDGHVQTVRSQDVRFLLTENAR